VGVARYVAALRRHDRPVREQRRRGARIDDEEYVGGYRRPESGYFLCVTRHLRPNPPPLEVVWILQTDDAGLIDRIVI
jgi:hypothetical protein